MKDFSMCSLSVFICVKERERGREGGVVGSICSACMFLFRTFCIYTYTEVGLNWPCL